MKIKIVAFLLLILCVPASAQIFALFQVGGAPSGWHQLHIGGGGFLVNGNQSADGKTTIVRGDVFGGYVSYNGAVWVDVLNSQAIPASIYTAGASFQNNLGQGRGGPYEFVVAPGNSNTLYMMWMGQIMVSTTSPPSSPVFSICGNWTQLTAATAIDGNNGPFRFVGPHFGVDPANANVAYFGTPSSGVFTTSNGCSTSSAISTSTIPAATGVSCNLGTCFPGHIIAFDSSGGTTGGKTNNIYVASWGNHITASFNAGSTWTTQSTGPTTALSMSVCSSGVVWVVSNTTDVTGGNYNLWKYSGGSGGTWTQLTSATLNGANPAGSVACDPNNASHVVVADQEGEIQWTSNAGTSFSGVYTNTGATHSVSISATDVPWIQWLFANNNGFTAPNIGQIFFDHGTANKLWLTGGFEVLFANNISTSMPAPQSAGAVAWQSFTAGLEVQDAIGVTSAPNGNNSVILNTEQLNWYIPNVNLGFNPYPSQGTPSSANTLPIGWSTLLPGWSSDYVGGTPNTVVGMANGLTNLPTNDFSWISTNSGASTTIFSSQTGAAPAARYGGQIAAASASVILQQANGFGPFITTNGGNSWSFINIPNASEQTTTTASTTTSSAVLTLSSVTGLVNGMMVYDVTNLNAIDGQTISSINVGAKQVTLNTNVLATVNNGDTIAFGIGWGSGAFSLNQQACADKVNNGTLYLMNSSNGLYVSTDGAGATWNLATGTGLTPAAAFLDKLICVPKLGTVNTAGHLIWSPGNYSNGNPVFFSNNQGSSWSQIPNITGANSVGVGAPKPGGNGYPTIWAVGTVNSIYGIYHCDNYNSASNTGCAISDWINVGTFPGNSLDVPLGIDGDQNTYGRAYVAMQGSGFWQLN